jgi:large subunit ribosomal protein L33
MECTEQRTSGIAGASRYITTKNKQNSPDRLERKKYNPFLKKVTLHREVK